MYFLKCAICTSDYEYVRICNVSQEQEQQQEEEQEQQQQQLLNF